MDTDLRIFLERTNPWFDDPAAAATEARKRLPATYLPRTVTPALRETLEDTNHAHLVIGPHQAGKSTSIWNVLAERSTPLLFLNCEEPLVRHWCRSPGLFAADLGEWLPEGGTVFFEEAQWLDEAGLFFKGLVDAHTGRRVMVTGSSSFHLLARTRESLAGRATRHRVWPLSLREVAPPAPHRPAAARRRDARAAQERQLIHGGYPEAWTAHDPPQVLHELVTAFVLRDASDRYRIERPDVFRLLLHLAAGQIGDLVNYTEWSQILGVATSTVSDYTALLEESHILRLVRPFIGGKRAEITQTPKVFYLDNGLRNAVAGGFGPLDQRTDLGKLLENWVFTELHKHFPEPGAVRYWRTRNGAEVDFVLEPTPGNLIGVEVKSHRARPPRISRALRSFIAAYSPQRILYIHRGEPGRAEIDGCQVQWVPAELLPEALEET